MTGTLSMSGNNLTQLGVPVRDRDAAYESYKAEKVRSSTVGFYVVYLWSLGLVLEVMKL